MTVVKNCRVYECLKNNKKVTVNLRRLTSTQLQNVSNLEVREDLKETVV